MSGPSPTHPAHEAIRAFWRLRTSAAEAQAKAGKSDTGTRGSVTAGQHMRGLEELITLEFVNAGFPESSIRRERGIDLPGYYRPSKKWDVVVVDRGMLVAAIEFKSQVGPSFGNNFNNRTEEALGSASDVWRAYEEGTFGQIRPWLGYFFILEEAPKSTHPVRTADTLFPVEDVFKDTSYKDRYRILCKRLVRERLYDAACFLTAGQSADDAIDEPDSELSFANFASSIAGRAAYIQSLPGQPPDGGQSVLL